MRQSGLVAPLLTVDSSTDEVLNVRRNYVELMAPPLPLVSLLPSDG